MAIIKVVSSVGKSARQLQDESAVNVAAPDPNYEGYSRRKAKMGDRSRGVRSGSKALVPEPAPD